MYTFAPVSVERRSAQTVMWKITEALVRLVAPILSFTADEVWGYLPKIEGREASVHLAEFLRPEEIVAEDKEVRHEWVTLLAVRDLALKYLEEKRKAKEIGKALEAKVIFHSRGQHAAILEKYQSALKELLNVSQVVLEDLHDLSEERPEFEEDEIESIPEQWDLRIEPADGIKCERCWNYRTDTGDYHHHAKTGENGTWPNVCGRCAKALDLMGYGDGRA